jgi:hypothetical protein
MVGRAHTKEPVGLLNVSSTNLKSIEFTFNNPTFLWYDYDLPSKRVFKCIEFNTLFVYKSHGFVIKSFKR